MSNAPPRRSKAALIRLASAGLACLATSAAADDDGPLQACRDITADAARLACYDKLADRPAPSRGAAPDGSPAPSPEELFGRDAAQSEDMVRRAAGIGRLDEITTNVIAVEYGTTGKVLLTLDNGQVWSQLDSLKVRIKSGDSVRIRRALLGSYLLTPGESKSSIRVRRSR